VGCLLVCLSSSSPAYHFSLDSLYSGPSY
jgi:hypothetical protein